MFTTAIFVVTLVSTFGAVFSNDDDFYCKAKPPNALGEIGTYQICRKCPSLEDDCETSNECQCDNIEIQKKGKKKSLKG